MTDPMTDPMADALANLREQLAKLSHEQWAGWMDYLFEKSDLNADETVTIPTWATKRWRKQKATPYHELAESEQDSDRREADKFLEVIVGMMASKEWLALTGDEAYARRIGEENQRFLDVDRALREKDAEMAAADRRYAIQCARECP